MPRQYIKDVLSFNDVLLVPQYSDIHSRLEPDTSTCLTPNIKIAHPVISTNMSTVTGEKMMRTMAKTGSVGLLHRFMPHEDIIRICVEFKRQHPDSPVVPSIGVQQEDFKLIDDLADKVQPEAVLIDIAHGHSDLVAKMLDYIVKAYPSIDVIAGNVATGDGAKFLADHGAKAVRTGVGGGSVCTTRTQTGHGIPTLTSIQLAHDAVNSYGVKVIGDGGFSTPGDIVKALAFGADTVSLGGMLAGTSDSPGDIFAIDGKQYKIFYGMSSKTAQESLRGGMKKGIAAEGMDKQVPYRGETIDVIEEIVGAIRSGFTYSGARSLEELRESAEYVILTSGSMRESKLA